MQPKIDSTSFGSIRVDGKKYGHDILIRRDGTVEKRKKILSKEIYGTSHLLSLEEARHIYESGTEKIIIGTGQTGFVELSIEAEAFFKAKQCKVELLPTPEAIKNWNKSKGKLAAMFHITC
ncbi:MAG: Mth938-like domain-containing protein [Methanosarcinaceae archaeon]|nr:Mth938-like domain-containing protein [Methanosarcinaceae archaeon]MDD4750136.1 Mth938-like domain-containing protein [Methanosarcinaceae archaeon]